MSLGRRKGPSLKQVEELFGGAGDDGQDTSGSASVGAAGERAMRAAPPSTATPPATCSNPIDSPRKMAASTMPNTASSVMITAVRDDPSRRSAANMHVNATAVASA